MQSLRAGVLLVAATAHACTKDAADVDVDTAAAVADVRVTDARLADAGRPEARPDATVTPDSAIVPKDSSVSMDGAAPRPDAAGRFDGGAPPQDASVRPDAAPDPDAPRRQRYREMSALVCAEFERCDPVPDAVHFRTGSCCEVQHFSDLESCTDLVAWHLLAIDRACRDSPAGPCHCIRLRDCMAWAQETRCDLPPGGPSRETIMSWPVMCTEGSAPPFDADPECCWFEGLICDPDSPPAYPPDFGDVQPPPADAGAPPPP